MNSNTLLKHVCLCMVGLLWMGGAQLFAQVSSSLDPANHLTPVDRSVVNDYRNSVQSDGNNPEANLSIFIDYDRMAGNDESFAWLINPGFSSDFDLNYAVLSVDTLLDTTGIGYALEDHVVNVDSVDIVFSHFNASGMTNQIITSIVTVGPTGLPKNTVLFADTLETDTSLTSSPFNFAVYRVRPNVRLCGEGFGVRVDFVGPTSDTLGVIGGYKDDCAGACGATRSRLYANSYYYLHLPQINYAQETPDSLGFGIFFDCNQNGMADLDSTGCEDFPLQEFLFFPYLTIEDRPNSTAVVTDDMCTSGTGAIDASTVGGQAPFTYSWSNGATTEDLSGLNAGTYTLTVTDASGCSGSSTYTVTSMNVPVSGTTMVTDADCGIANGSATLTPSSGTAPYTYSWNTNPVQTSQTALNLMAGMYTVTVTDANGCFNDFTINVGNIGGPTIDTTPITNVTCNGANDGTASANVSGGTAPYTYSWSNGTNGQTITNLAPGTYTVTVTDNQGCIKTASVTITEPPAITLMGISGTDATCNGEEDGTVTLMGLSGGTSPFTYMWSNGETTMNLTAVGAGTYSCVITDANGCTFQTGTTTIAEPPAIVLSTSSTADDGSGNGSATALVQGANSSDFNYVWSSGQSGMGVFVIFGIPAGTYTVTVTDMNGCSVMDTIVVDGPASIEDQLAIGLQNLELYPNPSSGVFTLAFDLQGRDDVAIRVLDLNGREVRKSLSQNILRLEEKIDLTGQASGMYLLQINTSKGSITQKMILD